MTASPGEEHFVPTRVSHEFNFIGTPISESGAFSAPPLRIHHTEHSVEAGMERFPRAQSAPVLASLFLHNSCLQDDKGVFVMPGILEAILTRFESA